MRAIVADLEQQYKGQVAVIRVNYADPRMRTIVAQYGATAHPAFVFLRKDGVEDDLMFGEVDQAHLQRSLDQIVMRSK